MFPASGKRESGADKRQPAPLDNEKASSWGPGVGDVKEHNLYTLSGNGVYVAAHVNHKQASVMLDTGATTSVIDEDIWRKSGNYHPEQIEPLDATLTVANGGSLPVQGCARIKLQIGNLSLVVLMLVVKDISLPVILGSGFFHNHGCQIAYDTGIFLVKDTEVPIHFQKSPPSLCRVYLQEKRMCELGTEVVTTVRLENGYEKNSGTPGVIECKRPMGLQFRDILGSLCFCSAKGVATVRIANFSDESVILKQGKALGHFHPLNRDFGSINSFSVVEGTTQAQHGTGENDKPNRDTSETTEDNELTVDQKSQFSSLLEEFHNLFAEDNNDLGMSDLVEHTTDTGNANPIKQAPRRLPPHKRHVVDEQLTDLLEAGRIEEFVSPWSSPIVLLPRKMGHIGYALTTGN